MRISILLLTLTLGLSPLAAMAGPGHGHSHGPVQITKNQAETIASYRIAELILAKELHESWSSATPTKVEKTTTGKVTEWMISYDNDKASDADKTRFFVFLSSTGEFITANFTGK